VKIVRVRKTSTILEIGRESKGGRKRSCSGGGTEGDCGGEDGLEIIWVFPFLRGRPGVCDVGDDTGLIALFVICETLSYSIYEESTYVKNRK